MAGLKRRSGRCFGCRNKVQTEGVKHPKNRQTADMTEEHRQAVKEFMMLRRKWRKQTLTNDEQIRYEELLYIRRKTSSERKQRHKDREEKHKRKDKVDQQKEERRKKRIPKPNPITIKSQQPI